MPRPMTPAASATARGRSQWPVEKAPTIASGALMSLSNWTSLE